jgi:hypothetical protein
MSTYFTNRAESGQRGCFTSMSSVHLFCIVLVMASGPIVRCAAQTNGPATFQGFKPGDTVRVKVDKPPMDLARAYFQSQTASNITVVSKGDRYCVEKSAVTLSPAQQRPVTEAVSATSTAQPVAGAVSVPWGQRHPSA